MEEIRRDVGKRVLGERGERAVGQKKQGECTPYAAWLEEGDHEQPRHHRDADHHSEEPFLLIGGHPVTVDGEAVDACVGYAEPEDLLESGARLVEHEGPEVRPAGQVLYSLGVLAAREPGDQYAGHGDDRGRHGRCGSREEPPHPRVDGEQAQAGDQDARYQRRQRGPGVREEQDQQVEGDADQGDTPLHQAGEPEHDRQSGCDRCVLGHLCGRHRPHHAGEPAVEMKRLTRGDDEAEQHRAERHVQTAKLIPQEQHVRPAPPWRQQPERSHEPHEPEGPVDLADMRSGHDGDYRVDGQQGHQAEKHVRAQPDLGVHGQGQQERQRQGALGERLADVGRDGQDAAGDVGEGVEEQQRPGGADPAPGRAIPCFGRLQCRYMRTAPGCSAGHQLRPLEWSGWAAATFTRVTSLTTAFAGLSYMRAPNVW